MQVVVIVVCNDPNATTTDSSVDAFGGQAQLEMPDMSLLEEAFTKAHELAAAEAELRRNENPDPGGHGTALPTKRKGQRIGIKHRREVGCGAVERPPNPRALIGSGALRGKAGD